MAAVVVLLIAAVPLAGWLALRGSLPPLDGRRALAGLCGNCHRRARRQWHSHHPRREQGRRLPRAGFPARAGPFLPDGPFAAAGGGGVGGVVRRRRIADGPRDAPAPLPPARGAGGGGVDPEQGRALAAYTAGVNAGLDALRARPWEYLVLRAGRARGRREDSLLVVDAMAMSPPGTRRPRRTAAPAMLETYGGGAGVFAAARPGSDGGAGRFVRNPRRPCRTPRTFRRVPAARAHGVAIPARRWRCRRQSWMPGTVHCLARIISRWPARGWRGAARWSPTTCTWASWCRTSGIARRWSCPGRTVTGVDAARRAGVVVGSNGDVAWGFTDAYIDTCDLVVVETDPARPARYRVPDGIGWERFETVARESRVARPAAGDVEVVSTRWGPLLTAADAAGRTFARHWSEYDPGAINLGMCRPGGRAHRGRGASKSRTAAASPRRISSWATARATSPGRSSAACRAGSASMGTPQSWADGTRRWDGFLPPDGHARHPQPADGPALDRQQPRGRRRRARAAGRRRLRRRGPRRANPRPAPRVDGPRRDAGGRAWPCNSTTSRCFSSAGATCS